MEDAARLRLRQVSGSRPNNIVKSAKRRHCFNRRRYPSSPDHSSSKSKGSHPTWCFVQRMRKILALSLGASRQGKSGETHCTVHRLTGQNEKNMTRHEDAEGDEIFFEILRCKSTWPKDSLCSQVPSASQRFGNRHPSHRLESASQQSEVLVKEVLKSWPWAPRQSGAHCSNLSNRHISNC